MSSLALRSLCNPDPFWSVSEMTTVSATVCILSLKYGTEAVYKKSVSRDTTIYVMVTHMKSSDNMNDQ